MSLKSSLLVATAMASYFGFAMAQTAPLVLPPAAPQIPAVAMPSVPAGPAPARTSAQSRVEPGFKPARPQPADTRAQPTTQKVVDESALLYYASLGQTARVASEIRRIKTLHPSWQPPENLFAAAGPQVEEKPLWDLYAAGRFEDLKEQIDALKTEFPDYRPSADLVTKADLAARRTLIVAASQQRDWEQVVAMATESQDLLVCREIDLLWRLAEAFSSLDNKEQAVAVYRYIIATCENANERLATVQKAALTLPEDELAKLIAAGRRGRNGTSEFDGVRLDIIRRDIGAIAAGQSAPTPSERDIKLIEASARNGRSAADAGLLGWHAYQAKDFARARDWFKLGFDVARDPKLLEGQILAMRNLGDLEQAKSLAFQNRSLGPLIRKAFIEIAATELPKPTTPALPAEQMRQVEELIESEKSGPGAQSLGWHLFHHRKFAEARVWFEKSTRWAESEDSVLGLALAMQRLGDRKAYMSFITENRGRYQTLARLGEVGQPTREVASSSRRARRGGAGGAPSGLVKQAVTLYETGKYKEAADLMDRNQQRLDPSMNALRGWAHFQANNYQESEKIFKKYKNVKGAEHGEFLSYIAGRSIAQRWYN